LTVADDLNASSSNESPLSRWSRLKRRRSAKNDDISESNENELIAQKDWAMKDDAGNDISVSPNPSIEAKETKNSSNEDALPSLTDIALDRDFTPFMQAKVPEALKRQALKTLFKDVHFNTMDGLDTYVDDYTKFEPITAEEMAGLSSWKSIMKPLEQVVTPGGYAVDVESEEGKAVLAAREALARGDDVSIPSPATRDQPKGAGRNEVAVPTNGRNEPEGSQRAEDEGGSSQAPDLVHGISPEPPPSSASGTFSRAAGEGMHERYGKRVGDFIPFDTSPAGGGQREALGERGDSVTKIDLQFEQTSLTRALGQPLPAGEVEQNDDPR
jgi:Protein of unknown function (DUF3306)